jgi:hypothetical protein
MRLLRFVSILAVTALMSLSAAPVFALGILPTSEPNINCNEFVKASDSKSAYQSATGFGNFIKGNATNRDNVLGCAIKTGRIKLYMMPFYITYLIEFLLAIAGLISVLFVIYGGFKYTIGGLIEDKESGKKTIMYALLGLVVALSSWMIVNFIMVALTS